MSLSPQAQELKEKLEGAIIPIKDELARKSWMEATLELIQLAEAESESIQNVSGTDRKAALIAVADDEAGLNHPGIKQMVANYAFGEFIDEAVAYMNKNGWGKKSADIVASLSNVSSTIQELTTK